MRKPIFVGKCDRNDKYILHITEDKFCDHSKGMINLNGAWVKPCDIKVQQYEKLLISHYKNIARKALATELAALIALETGEHQVSSELVNFYLYQFLNSKEQINLFFKIDSINKPPFIDEILERIQSPFPKELEFTSVNTVLN